MHFVTPHLQLFTNLLYVKMPVSSLEMNGSEDGNFTLFNLLLSFILFFILIYFIFNSNAHLWCSLCFTFIYFVSIKNKKAEITDCLCKLFFMFEQNFRFLCKYCSEKCGKKHTRGAGCLEGVARVSLNTLFSA